MVVLVFVNNDFANNSALLEAIRNGWHPEHAPRLYFAPDGSRMAQDPNWAGHLIPRKTQAERAAWLRETSPDYASKLAGWDPTQEPMDFVFYEPKLPPAFEDALASTEAVSSFPLPPDRRHNQLHRLRTILDELHIPLLDLGPEFEKRGSLGSTILPYDGHFNATGHRWAADAIADYLIRERLVHKPGESPSTRSPAQEGSGTAHGPNGG